MTRGLQVVDAGIMTCCQDLGRRGQAHWGVPRSGAADRGALRLANRLVGNLEGEAALEVLAGAVALRAEGDLVVAVTGATCTVRVGRRLEGRNVAVRLADGEVLELGPATRGLRAYVGVRGGVALPAVLGSRSYDQLGDLGPAPLRAGDHVPVGAGSSSEPQWEQAPLREIAAEPLVRVLPGPRVGWLTDGLDALLATTWSVSSELDRIGVRLTGSPLRRESGELPSEGMVQGAIQVPADGQPILLGPDAGVTGGYPVVAVVIDADLDVVGQLRPGDTVRFRLRRAVSG